MKKNISPKCTGCILICLCVLLLVLRCLVCNCCWLAVRIVVIVLCVLFLVVSCVLLLVVFCVLL